MKIASLGRTLLAQMAMGSLLVVASLVGATVANAQDAALTAVVEIPDELLMTAEGHGFDNQDAELSSTGGPIQFTAIGAPVSLPVPVQEGIGLLEYTDSGSGMTIRPVPSGHVVRIPIRDGTGNDTIRILLTVEDLIGTGDAVEGTVTAIDIDLPDRSVDLSSDDPRVGTAVVKVLGSLSSFPGQSGMTMTIAKQPDAEAREAFDDAALAMGLEVDEIAFATGFAKTGLDQSIDEITLRMSLARGWVDDVGLGNIRVFRQADDGAVEVLEATVEDPNAASIRFNVSSPNGLSTFVIAAVSAAATPTPTVTPSPTATVAQPITGPTATLPPTPGTKVPTIEPPTATPTAGDEVGGEANGGSQLMIVGLVATAAVLAGGGLFMARRRS